SIRRRGRGHRSDSTNPAWRPVHARLATPVAPTPAPARDRAEGGWRGPAGSAGPTGARPRASGLRWLLARRFAGGLLACRGLGGHAAGAGLGGGVLAGLGCGRSG